jgi:Rrf2 family protein
MLTETTETAIRVLLYLASKESSAPVPPRPLAERFGASPSYLAKVTGALAKAGLAESRRGAHGGVLLARNPESVTLLEIVEAMQGRILGDYCTEDADPSSVCAFHQAMLELHEAIVGVLRSWTLADLARKPLPDGALAGFLGCKMACVAERAQTEHQPES